MSIRREPVHLELNDNFSAGIARARTVAERLGRELLQRDATWEPIDWSEFD